MSSNNGCTWMYLFLKKEWLSLHSQAHCSVPFSQSCSQMSNLYADVSSSNDPIPLRFMYVLYIKGSNQWTCHRRWPVLGVGVRCPGGCCICTNGDHVCWAWVAPWHGSDTLPASYSWATDCIKADLDGRTYLRVLLP